MKMRFLTSSLLLIFFLPQCYVGPARKRDLIGNWNSSRYLSSHMNTNENGHIFCTPHVGNLKLNKGKHFGGTLSHLERLKSMASIKIESSPYLTPNRPCL